MRIVDIGFLMEALQDDYKNWRRNYLYCFGRDQSHILEKLVNRPKVQVNNGFAPDLVSGFETLQHTLVEFCGFFFSSSDCFSVQFSTDVQYANAGQIEI